MKDSEAYFDSEENRVPEINLRRMDLISSLITTFERNDLESKNSMNMYYDKTRDYVFMDLVADVNGKRIADYLAGWDKEKILNFCNNVIKYFEKDELDAFKKYLEEKTNNAEQG